MKLRHLAAGATVVPFLLLAACRISPIDYTPRYTDFMSANIVLGQGDFTSNQANQGSPTPASDTMNAPVGSVGTYPYASSTAQNGYYVPDTGNNRVLGFNGINNNTADQADFVLGQTDLYHGAVNENRSSPDGSTLSEPAAVANDSSHLAVADSGNNRVLVWNSLPTTTNASATLALGQQNLTTSASACDSTGMHNPRGVAIAGGKVIVADSGNNRVLIWNDVTSLVSGQAPNEILGQTAPGSCSANQGNTSPSAKTLSDPTSVWSNGTELIVADSGNNRVLIWNDISAISSNDVAADVVVGQPDMTSGSPGASQTLMNDPKGVDGYGGGLYVADTGNNRVLIFDSRPASNDAAADIVLGQSDFTHHAANDDNQDGSPDATPTDRTLDAPAGLRAFSQGLMVADTGNNRWLDFQKHIPNQ
ncbi:MAG TPA: NHL repeat-containing protein [Gammaproteobacteria bacterium]|nr:NHL repeat-containing protein [Gammaproteobacteria bacterium]